MTAKPGVHKQANPTKETSKKKESPKYYKRIKGVLLEGEWYEIEDGSFRDSSIIDDIHIWVEWVEWSTDKKIAVPFRSIQGFKF